MKVRSHFEDVDLRHVARTNFFWEAAASQMEKEKLKLFLPQNLGEDQKKKSSWSEELFFSQNLGEDQKKGLLEL